MNNRERGGVLDPLLRASDGGHDKDRDDDSITVLCEAEKV